MCLEIDAKTILSRIRTFRTSLMHDGVYGGPYYTASKGKSHFKYAHNFYHELYSHLVIFESKVVIRKVCGPSVVTCLHYTHVFE